MIAWTIRISGKPFQITFLEQLVGMGLLLLDQVMFRVGMNHEVNVAGTKGNDLKGVIPGCVQNRLHRDNPPILIYHSSDKVNERHRQTEASQPRANCLESVTDSLSISLNSRFNLPPRQYRFESGLPLQISCPPSVDDLRSHPE